MKNNITVSFNNVCYRYESKKAQTAYSLSDITFSAASGDVIGIIGHNGAGKSTILKLMARIISPDAGNVSVNGKVSTLLSMNSGQILSLTGKENIIITGILMGLTKKVIMKKLEAIVEFSQLGELINKPIKTYSSGMRARLSFSTLVHVDTDILLLDEIFSVGDAEFRERSRLKMQENIRASHTSFIVSHDMAFIKSICNKVLLLDHGRVKIFADPETVIPIYDHLVEAKFPSLELVTSLL